jgi:Glycosyltransferase (GlcNAc)
MSIFLAIPSYCDPVLSFTLASAYDNAKYPDQLHFAVIDQSPMDAAYPIPAKIPTQQVSYIKIEASQSRGCCWARSLAMSLYRDEDYFFQLDSHMMFAQDWDEILVGKMKSCLSFSKAAVISSYPASFRFIEGVATPVKSIHTVRAAILRAGAAFQLKQPGLPFTSKQIEGVGAVQGYHIAGGCMFAPRGFVRTVPNDPYLYFNEEEQNLSLRLYTHGWDIYHVTGLPIYHLYNDKHVITDGDKGDRRPLHWDPAANSAEKPKWQAQVRRAQRRMATLVWGDASKLGVYGLGEKRTLHDYAEMCGIDYPQRTISQKAFDGPWTVPEKIADSTSAPC